VERVVAELVSAPAVPGLQPGAATPAEQTGAKATALAILESLSRGELSVDEAEALLRSLEPA
jgi:hypothetical protein